MIMRSGGMKQSDLSRQVGSLTEKMVLLLLSGQFRETFEVSVGQGRLSVKRDSVQDSGSLIRRKENRFMVTLE